MKHATRSPAAQCAGSHLIVMGVTRLPGPLTSAKQNQYSLLVELFAKYGKFPLQAGHFGPKGGDFGFEGSDALA